MSNVISGINLGAPIEHQYTCSRAGCRDEASWVLQWRNPKIHTPERKKQWLACDAHLDVLRTFLEDRSFPLEVLAVSELGE